jgi:hypothetical protein
MAPTQSLFFSLQNEITLSYFSAKAGDHRFTVEMIPLYIQSFFYALRFVPERVGVNKNETPIGNKGLEL